MTADRRSPIERMIDAATGYDPGVSPSVKPPLVTLQCPKCDRRKSAKLDKTDPEGTTLVVVLCNKCDDGGNFPEVLYYDAQGNQLVVP